MEDEFLLSLFDSLKREIKQDIQPMKDALERIESRLTRQGGIVQGGSRQVARLVGWSEDMDQLIAQGDVRIEELERRLDKLEHPTG